MRTRLPARLPALALLPVLALTGCAAGPAAGVPAGDWSPVPSGSGTPLAAATTGAASADQAQARPSRSACSRDGWTCAQEQHFEAVTAYMSRLPGTVGVVVQDRQTGAVWRAGAPDQPMWTASTIKVAIATTLLERQRAGKVHLSGADRKAMADMLRSSSNDATDTLWNKYDGADQLDRFRSAYGMTGLAVVRGDRPYWRNLRCTADDLDHLMAYVLGANLHPDDRSYLVDTLRSVAGNQHWGVWAAGSQLAPGNKDGWAEKPDPGGDHWVAHTAGFAGPDERYVVVVMYSLRPGGTLDDGVQAVSDVAALVFGGRTPTKVSAPD